MKKLYKSPVSEQLNLEIAGVIATSSALNDITVGGGDVNETTILSNGKDMWGNDTWE